MSRQSERPAHFLGRWRVQCGHSKHAGCVGLDRGHVRESGRDMVELEFADGVRGRFTPHELFPAPHASVTGSEGTPL